MSLNPLWGKNSVHWQKVERPLGSGLSTMVSEVMSKWCLSTWLAWSHDHVNLSGLGTSLTDSITWQTHLPHATAELRNTRSLAHHWQTHLPDATSLHPDAVPNRGTGGSYVEKPAETLRQASASYCSYPNLEDMSSNPLCGKNSVHWLKVERPLGSGLSTVYTFWKFWWLFNVP